MLSTYNFSNNGFIELSAGVINTTNNFDNNQANILQTGGTIKSRSFVNDYLGVFTQLDGSILSKDVINSGQMTLNNLKSESIYNNPFGYMDISGSDITDTVYNYNIMDIKDSYIGYLINDDDAFITVEHTNFANVRNHARAMVSNFIISNELYNYTKGEAHFNDGTIYNGIDNSGRLELNRVNLWAYVNNDGVLTLNDVVTGKMTNTGDILFVNGGFKIQSLNNSGYVIMDNATVDIGGVELGDIKNSDTIELIQTQLRLKNLENSNGTFSIQESEVHMNNLDNNAEYKSGSSHHFFNNINIGESGYLVAGENDEFFIEGDFHNLTDQFALWETSQASFHFIGDEQQKLFLRSQDLGAILEGYMNNLALGTLHIDDNVNVELYGNSFTALYVDRLILDQGSNWDLRGFNIYYLHLEDYGADLTLGNGNLVQVAPEPLSMVLMMVGGSLMWWRRFTCLQNG
jgi:hypothetical protein